MHVGGASTALSNVLLLHCIVGQLLARALNEMLRGEVLLALNHNHNTNLSILHVYMYLSIHIMSDI